MKMRTLMMGMFAAGLVASVGSARAAERIEIAVNSIPEIKVDGAGSDGPYDSIQTKTLEYLVSARSNRYRNINLFIPKGEYDLHYIRTYWLKTHVDESWNKYKLTIPYMDPEPGEIVNERTSPIKLCNERLNKTSGAEREQFLKSGAAFTHHGAFHIKAHDSGDTMNFDYGRTLAPVKIVCMKLDRPRPRQDTSTKGPPPREGKQMQPTIKEMTLRVEPAKVVQDGKFLCPSQLKLYGFVETRRAFYGKALFVGPHYLSSITTLNLQSKGTRNVGATYEMDWHKMGGFATQPNAEPKKQKLTFRFNIADKDGKLLKSVEETVEVSCKKIKVNAPTAGDGMTVKPAN